MTTTRNPWAKTRPLDNSYMSVTNSNGGWTWRILKAYQTPSKIAGNRFARFFCAVWSPFTNGGWEMGDVYARDLPGLAKILNRMEEDAAKVEVAP